MPSNSCLHLITKLINFDGVKAIDYHFITDNEILITLSNQTLESTCPHCHTITNKIHQSHYYRIRDIPFSTYDVFLNINRRQFRCTNWGKIFSEELNFVKKRRTYTIRLADKVVKEVMESDILNTAKRNGMTPREIETLLQEKSEDLLEEKPRDLKRLGIDEITQLKGGKNYAAVLVDLDKKKPIAILENRSKETIKKYLISLGWDVLQQIKEVSIDLWIGYKSLTEELMPNAQIVADRFHVMKQINEELDLMRKKEKRTAEKIKNKAEREEKVEGLKNSKYPLLKKKENLNELEKEKLKEVNKIAPELIKMYEEKESWRDIFESEITGEEALDKIAEWMKSGQKYFPESCKTIRRWLDEILAYFDNRTSQGIVEGINQKIKLIKRRAYGMTNFDNFQRRILLNWAVS
jgi:transposase